MKKLRGFTIIELIIVIVIIGILVAVVTITFNSTLNKSKKTQVISALNNISGYLASEYMANDQYPANLNDVVNVSGGVSVDNSVSPFYEYKPADDSYCLTVYANKGETIAYHVTNDDTTPKEGGCTGHRINANLIENGFGEKGNNTGFPDFDFSSTDKPDGADGSFVSKTGSYIFYCNAQRVPIDKTKKYKISGWARQTVPAVTTATWYFGLCPYDIDGHYISPSSYMFRPGTTTTLAQPLKTGDTVVRLTNVSTSWYNVNDANTHNRSFIFWNYKDGKGKTWPVETYSRNPWYSNMWDGGSTNVNTTTNTITLNKPWPGGNYPAGQPVSNGSAGGTYMYSAASAQNTPASWKQFTSPVITGTVTGLNSASTKWPISAESASVLIGLNAGSPPTTSRQAVGGIDFYEVQ